VTIWPLDTVDFAAAKEAVETVLRENFGGHLLGKAIYRTQLGSLIEKTGLIKTYEIHLPESNVEADPRQLPVLGALTVQEGE